MPLSSELVILNVGARTSPLSRVQLGEVYNELKQTHPYIEFAPEYVKTVGDRDQMTSLRSLGKSNFFTAELDRMVLDCRCRIAIHSAKDLPDPLAEGLCVIAVTSGIDPSDALVLREGENLETLEKGARIATSSERREEMVNSMRDDLSFIDLRGTIEKRLEKLQTGEADGVVIAEAALIRLQLTHLNRVILPGATVPGQGQLAVTSRSDDEEMRTLFSCIDCR
ncbi:MAG: hydroxymethylbilane synthase [Chlamydiota bacterium]